MQGTNSNPWLAAVVVAVIGWPAAAPVAVEASRMSMGCLYSIAAYGANTLATKQALEAALDEVDRIDRLMSHYRADSALSQINREAAGRAVPVPPQLFEFLQQSIRYSTESDGAFDITVGPLMKAWGFFRGEGRVPGERELDDARQRVGFRHVILDARERTVRFDRPGVELDLGGIAKGYAVDRAVALLRKRRVSSALVNACGSTLYALGTPPGHDAWEIAVEDPVDSRAVAFEIELRDRAMSVAGGAEKWFEEDGVRYTHIMDPRTGRPAQGVLTVVVLAADGTEGDALDNALFVQGVARAGHLLASRPDAEAYFFLEDPQRRWRVVHVPDAPGRAISGERQ